MSLFLRNKVWHYEFVLGGGRHRGSTGFSEHEKAKAIAAEAKLKVEVREGHSIEMIWEQTKRKMIASSEIAMAFSDIWDEFSKKGMSNAGIERKKLYASHIREFCNWVEFQHSGIKTVSLITEDIANEFITYLRGLPGAPATKNDKLSTLKMLFSVLGKSAGIIENPFENISKQKHIQTDRNVYDFEELKLIGKKSRTLWDNNCGNRWIYSFCLAALYTGQREGDICSFKKSYFDLKNHWIHIPNTGKTGKTFDFPLLPGLERHIRERFAENNDSEYVFPELVEKYQKDSSSIGKELKDFYTTIGITGLTMEVTGYKRKVSVKDAHSYRHTTIWLASIYQVPFSIVSEAFHDTPAMTKRYMSHANRVQKEKFFNQIPELFEGAIPDVTSAEKKLPKELSRERMIHLLNRITADNVEKTKKRLMALLQAELAQPSGLSR